MKREDFLKFLFATSTLSGTIIGAGFFTLPYITLKSGTGLMIIYFFLLSSIVFLIHWYFGKLALKTPDEKRLPGFVKIYLGKNWGKFSFLISIFGLVGVLLVYLILGGEFLKNLLSPIFGQNNLFWTTIYFIFASLLIFRGIRTIAKVEFFSLIFFFLILFFTFIKNLKILNFKNLFQPTSFSFWFLPYGPLFFSLWGCSLIPQTEEILKERKNLLKMTIFFSILIAVIFYLFFIFLVLGISGQNTTPSALSGLKNFLPSLDFTFLHLFAFLAIFTSFITLGSTLKDILQYDLGMKKVFALTISIFSPFLLFLFGLKKFLPLISFLGGVMLGIEGILILLMYRKIEKKNFSLFLLCFLVFGIFFEIFTLATKKI